MTKQGTRLLPGDASGFDDVEVAFVTRGEQLHTVLRQNDTTLEFTESEWRAFAAGVRDGEFGEPC